MYRFLVRPAWLGRLAAALALAVVMSLLGAWQLSRYEDRAAVNARIDEAGAPAPLAEVVAPPPPTRPVGPAAPADADWARVTATGRYDPDHEILVRGRTVQGRVGYEVLTPLVRPDGTAILVDRGWVPPAGTGITDLPDVPPAPAGTVTVTGRVRPSESGAGPVERVAGVRQSRRIVLAALAPHVPEPLYGAYLLRDTQQPPADPGLVPVPVRRENAWLNAGYAVQWWVFAGLVLAGFGWLARREARRSDPRPPAVRCRS